MWGRESHSGPEGYTHHLSLHVINSNVHSAAVSHRWCTLKIIPQVYNARSLHFIIPMGNLQKAYRHTAHTTTINKPAQIRIQYNARSALYHTEIRFQFDKNSWSYLGNLAVCGEEYPSERVREATAVSSKETAGLVHVCSELKHLLHCWTHTYTHITLSDSQSPLWGMSNGNSKSEAKQK